MRDDRHTDLINEFFDAHQRGRLAALTRGDQKTLLEIYIAALQTGEFLFTAPLEPMEILGPHHFPGATAESINCDLYQMATINYPDIEFKPHALREYFQHSHTRSAVVCDKNRQHVLMIVPVDLEEGTFTGIVMPVADVKKLYSAEIDRVNAHIGGFDGDPAGLINGVPALLLFEKQEALLDAARVLETMTGQTIDGSLSAQFRAASRAEVEAATTMDREFISTLITKSVDVYADTDRTPRGGAQKEIPAQNNTASIARRRLNLN